MRGCEVEGGGGFGVEVVQCGGGGKRIRCLKSKEERGVWRLEL